MNPIEKDDIIEKYIRGELNGDVLNQFVLELQQNKQLIEDVKLHREMNEFLKDSNAIEFRNTLDDIYKKHKKNKKGKIIRLFASRWQYAAAAVLLLLVLSSVLYFALKPTKNEKLYAQYYKTYDASGVVRGNMPESDNKEFGKAIDAYNSGDYETSYTLLNKLGAKICLSDSSFAEVNFFIGVSAMQNENFDSAILSFEKVLKNEGSLYVESAQWYQALCYLRKNEREMALALFSKIVSVDNCYKTKAQEIIDDLKN
jgi:tetratricopeptide (TPR) repeat protein